MIFNDIKYCRGNTKGQIFIVAFRISNYLATTRSKLLRVIGSPVRVLYVVVFDWLLSIDVKDSAQIGLAFNVYHGHSLVISADTKIGNYVKVRHSTTIGNSKSGGGSPVIGDFVDIGAHSVIIGEIHVGDHSIIAAGAVVVKDVPSWVVVAGNPAKIIRHLSTPELEEPSC